MNTPALFKGKYTGTGIQHPHKSNKSLVAHPPVAFVEIVPVPPALGCISHVPIPWHSK